jgi:hypothetical protein
MPLSGALVETTSLLSAEICRMFSLMQQYFIGITYEAFLHDLMEKSWVIILRDADTGLLHGFSTLCLMTESVQDIPVRAFFSGDTIINRPYWGSLEFGRVWFHHVYNHINAQPDARWYWFLICKGYRTYRYLPVYFHRYYPSPEPMPLFEREVLDRLAMRRFGHAYDAGAGVIRCRQDYRLRAGVGDISERERRDPRIAFFEERNPGWWQGDELACLTSLAYGNLKRIGFRMLGKEPVG